MYAMSMGRSARLLVSTVVFASETPGNCSRCVLEDNSNKGLQDYKTTREVRRNRLHIARLTGWLGSDVPSVLCCRSDVK